MEVEGGAKEPVIPALARAEVKSIAQEIASAEAKEVLYGLILKTFYIMLGCLFLCHKMITIRKFSR